MRVNLHIERLVLENVDVARGDSDALAAAVQAELEQLVSARAPRLTASATVHSARDHQRLEANAGIHGVARAVAGAVGRQLAPARTAGRAGGSET